MLWLETPPSPRVPNDADQAWRQAASALLAGIAAELPGRPRRRPLLVRLLGLPARASEGRQ
jgi:hypothetical protein